MERTEFFENAVQQGFYGNEKTSLWGKKDNVRRFWEDIFTKLLLGPAVAQLLKERPRLRVVDLGCGSGEGLDLLRHIPIGASPHEPSQNFLMNWPEIEIYDGVDLSSAMILQGQTNYANRDNAQFTVGDLSEGFPLTDRPPYHLYLSTYASLSHLTLPELEHLLCDIFKHAQEHAYVLIDVYGRCSPEWPVYWSASASKLEPYTMAYLYDQRQLDKESVEWFKVSYWTTAELENAVQRAAEKAGVRVNVSAVKDRSILVGRHMGTTFFKDAETPYRYQVNRLFDRDYRGEISCLCTDLRYLEGYASSAPEAFARIREYAGQWQFVVDTMSALMRQDRPEVKRLIESAEPVMSDELKMLAWTYRNADRFPVVDFWASVMGPQVACVLRNLEMSLPPGLGCGHSLLCMLEIEASNSVV